MPSANPDHNERRPVDIPRDCYGNPDWAALTGQDPFTQAREAGYAAPEPDPERDDAAAGQPPGSGRGGQGSGGGNGPPSDSPRPDEANPGGQSPTGMGPDGAWLYTQRDLERLDGASVRHFPDMNATPRGPDNLPRTMVHQLVSPLAKPIRIVQPDGEEQTLDPARTPFIVRDVRGRVHALSADEYEALVEQGRRLEAEQGAQGGGHSATLLAGGLAALVSALRFGRPGSDGAQGQADIEAANAQAMEHQRYEPWWSTRAQADVAAANEQIAQAVEIGRRLRQHPALQATVSGIDEANARTVNDADRLNGWMDMRKAGRDLSRQIESDPALYEHRESLRAYLEQAEWATAAALEAADQARGQDDALHQALQGFDIGGLQEATDHLRLCEGKAEGDESEDNEAQVERLRRLVEAVQKSVTRLVDRMMNFGRGSPQTDSGPQPGGG